MVVVYVGFVCVYTALVECTVMIAVFELICEGYYSTVLLLYFFCI